MLGLALVLLVHLWHYQPFHFMAPEDRIGDRPGDQQQATAIYTAHWQAIKLQTTASILGN